MNFRLRFTIIFYSCLILISCKENRPSRDYRQDMRDFVENISIYCRSFSSSFIIIPQNGIEIVSLNGKPDGPLAESYLSRISGVAQKDLFFGYDNDDELTPVSERNYLLNYLDRIKNYPENRIVWTIDYCSTHSKIDSSYQWNFNKNYVSFASPSREMNLIPDYPQYPYRYNIASVKSIASVKNFLYLIKSEQYPTKTAYINALESCKYDALLIDLFFKDTVLTATDLERIRYKPYPNVPRIVLCYMSVGEAENYRYYWNISWNSNPPSWLERENPDWPGNYKVQYWNNDWQNIIYGNDLSYARKIIHAGFNGAYLDIIDAYEYFE